MRRSWRRRDQFCGSSDGTYHRRVRDEFVGCSAARVVPAAGRLRTDFLSPVFRLAFGPEPARGGETTLRWWLDKGYEP